jgi:hypothetical protein
MMLLTPALPTLLARSAVEVVVPAVEGEDSTSMTSTSTPLPAVAFLPPLLPPYPYCCCEEKEEEALLDIERSIPATCADA